MRTVILVAIILLVLIGCSGAPRYSDVDVHTFEGCIDEIVLSEETVAWHKTAPTDEERIMDYTMSEFQDIYQRHLSYTGPALGFYSAMAVDGIYKFREGDQFGLRQFVYWEEAVFDECAEVMLSPDFEIWMDNAQ